MIANWQAEFAPHILARGKKYFEDGNVGHIQHSIDTYIAAVAGTDDYEVEISIAEDRIKEMRCTCPYTENAKRQCSPYAGVLQCHKGNYKSNTLSPF